MQGSAGYLHSLRVRARATPGPASGPEGSGLAAGAADRARRRAAHAAAAEVLGRGRARARLLRRRCWSTMQHEGDEALRRESELLLDMLTPIVKAWGSEYALKANDLAIQVLGGYGFTREYPVEQCYRDNRLNPIHEGTNGIQAHRPARAQGDDAERRRAAGDAARGPARHRSPRPMAVGLESLHAVGAVAREAAARIAATDRACWPGAWPRGEFGACAGQCARCTSTLVGHALHRAGCWLRQALVARRARRCRRRRTATSTPGKLAGLRSTSSATSCRWCDAHAPPACRRWTDTTLDDRASLTPIVSSLTQRRQAVFTAAPRFGVSSARMGKTAEAAQRARRRLPVPGSRRHADACGQPDAARGAGATPAGFHAAPDRAHRASACRARRCCAACCMQAPLGPRPSAVGGSAGRST